MENTLHGILLGKYYMANIFLRKLITWIVLYNVHAIESIETILRVLKQHSGKRTDPNARSACEWKSLC